jgi:hypothetical protein
MGFVGCSASVMKNNNSEANAAKTKPPRLKEWSHWKRRCFIGLLCALELAMIAAIIFGITVLWSDLGLS